MRGRKPEAANSPAMAEFCQERESRRGRGGRPSEFSLAGDGENWLGRRRKERREKEGWIGRDEGNLVKP